MHEEKSRADSVTPTKEDAEQDATSKETVSDLEKNDHTSGSETSGGSEATESSSAPSPDGQFDAPRDGAGPGDETGPM
ncbi:MAG TPA: hypothetical protein VGC66_00250 [Pyrinomonadaceae bacterium]|jgi:hypothetical protein